MRLTIIILLFCSYINGLIPKAVNPKNCCYLGVDRNEIDQKDTRTCVPLVSVYTDCSPENECTGCTKCVCTTLGQWECHSIHHCEAFQTDKIDEELFDAAIDKLDYELKNQKQKGRGAAKLYSPAVNTMKDESQELLEIMNSFAADQNLKHLSKRQKRSTLKNTKHIERKHNKRSTEKAVKKKLTRNSSNNNNTVKFYSTVDELNEDTLTHSNLSGTLHAKRVQLNVLPDISRRSNIKDNNNESLHIDFNKPQDYNHITDNKIDNVDHENKLESHEKLNIGYSNHTQTTKDKNLSKLVVNELKSGSEIIGDSHAPITSNITFTAENDTLTAMAFIAGNLLNKLWNMEKDTSGTSWETEDLKQEKIADLLDLFKEPLNLRQEAFLKNALEKLSSAIDKSKDVTNFSICQTIDEATKLINNNSNSEEIPVLSIKEQKPCRENNESNKEEIDKRAATAKAISKINNVLGLIRKFENAHISLNNLKNKSDIDLKNGINITKTIRKKLGKDPKLNQDELESLNIFGTLLDRITKLLMPKSSHKKMTDILKNKNALGNDQNFKNNFYKMYHIDLSNMTVTAKDKLILDYITHINNNPDCSLNGKNHKTVSSSLPNIEGNILLNLSEFFKLKSYTDLINLLHPDKGIGRTAVTTNKPVKPKAVTSTPENHKKIASTREKLKSHLKNIIEDLIELQNFKGITPRGNIRVADALPCIYNIMNAGKEIFNKNKEQGNEANKIIEIFNELKHEMEIPQTRRNEPIMRIRPKSAIVFERIIRNVAEKSKLKTRRALAFKALKARVLKPIDGLNNIMNKLKNVSSVYKNYALTAEVPAADKLMLLKALAEDVKSYITVLERIKESYQNISQLPPDQFNNVVTFILNSATNITLNAKVIKKVEINKLKRIHAVDITERKATGIQTLTPPSLKPLRMLNWAKNNGDDNMKISRHQIINHLIRNRLKIFMKFKESKELDLENDLNYNIAKRVIFYLDSGNNNLAHELFKMLVLQKHDKLNFTSGNDQLHAFTLPPPKNPDIPISQFVEPKSLNNQMKWTNQDHLIKQLLNIKNMGL